jgi:hypothetical protein
VLCHLWGLAFVFFPAVGVLLALSVITGLLYASAVARLGTSPRADRLQSAITMSLYPLLALRAVAQAGRGFLAGAYPVAVALNTMKEDAGTVARGLLRDFNYPLVARLDDPLSRRIATWYSAALLEHSIDSVVEQAPGLRDELFGIPTGFTPGSRYCPRCLCQYDALIADCPDCSGIALVEVPLDALPQT